MFGLIIPNIIPNIFVRVHIYPTPVYIPDLLYARSVWNRPTDTAHSALGENLAAGTFKVKVINKQIKLKT
jgi:hypothetical protein